MTEAKLKKLAKEIRDYLKKYDEYEPADDILIDELVYNLAQVEACKRSIKERGLVINTTRDPNKDPYYTPNPAATQYHNFLRNVKEITGKLGLSPKDRRTLNYLISEDEADDIQQLIG